VKAAISWMAGNKVAANLFMLIFLLGGLFMGKSIKQEVFPEFTMDWVVTSVAYPGAGPEEVEDSICLAIEEAISGLNGLRRLTSNASEGNGGVVAEVVPGYDIDLFVQDVKAEVDRIRTFPQEAERPIITKLMNREEVLSLIVYGDLDEWTLREQAEVIRDELLALPEITQIDLADVRPYEISIDISEENLRRYGMTLNQVAGIVRNASRDMPGGVVRASGGEILLRTKERRYTGEEYEDIVVFSHPDGRKVRLRNIANVRDTFMETDQSAILDGFPAASVNVFRVGDQTPVEVSDAVKSYIKSKEPFLPNSVNLAIWNDRSEILDSRLQLLIRNGKYGLVLIALLLGYFMNVRLAFWVMLGIPISFLGAMLFMPMFNTSINMMSLFAFILALGIVVDDAIVVGENIYAHRMMGKSYLQAAIDGVMEVSNAVIFAILTTVVAFMPLLFVTGVMGKFMWVVPTIVISVLLISLFEVLFILPAHLAHSTRTADARGIMHYIQLPQQAFAPKLERFIKGPYRRFLEKAVNFRYTTIAVSFALLLMAIGMLAGGRVKFVFMPEVDAEEVSASLSMPFGTPKTETMVLQELLLSKAVDVLETLKDKYPENENIVRNIYASIGSQSVNNGPGITSGSRGGHLAQVRVFLVSGEQRSFASSEFQTMWRDAVGEVPGIESLTFKSSLMSMGEDLSIQVGHQDFNALIEISDKLKQAIGKYGGTEDITDSYALGKRELKLTLKPEARTLGITEASLGSQVRGAFYGAEALRIQRGRNEIKVMVRLPEEERQSIGHIENLRIRTPQGGEVPFYRAAEVDDGRGYSSINRANRKRIINVTANVDEEVANAEEILSELKATTFPQLLADYPGLSFDMEGQQRDMADSIGSLQKGFSLALFVIYALLAILFGSYVQPLIVMSAIPFGFIGAILGHLMMGYNLSILSMFGLVALTGVLVNDSLVLIDFVNRGRKEGKSAYEAVIAAGLRRFRPIVLTSLTTFLGLMPMITETSMQAKFLIPMAITLAFGVIFATGITLVLIPALYVALEDIRNCCISNDDEEIQAAA
jgi:multidrug efflux pump subunit AcrB